MANTRFTQFFFTPHMVPVLLDCNFVVDPANGNGLGIRNLKGQGIFNVFMHTTAPLVGSGNPNPAPGIVLVQFGENFNRYYGGFAGFEGPLSGAPIAVVTGPLVVGNAYVIVVVGTTTQAQWVALGLSPGTTAAVGVAFTAIAATTPGTGMVEAQLASGVNDFELIGDPNATFANQIPAFFPGSLNNTASRRPILTFQIMGPTSAGVTTPIPTAPAIGTTCAMAFYLSNSSVIIKGE
jgi:hypothetical protein